MLYAVKRQKNTGDRTAKHMASPLTEQNSYISVGAREQHRLQRYSIILEMLINDSPLDAILQKLVVLIEVERPGMVASICRQSSDGKHLLRAVSVSLPDFYSDALAGLEVGEGVGSCGTAIARRERVIVEDIDVHPYWAGLRDIALKAGLKACWSEPIISASGQMLGTFGMYYDRPRSPDTLDIELIVEAGQLAGLALEFSQALTHQRVTAAIFTHLPHALIIADADKNVLSVNPAYTAITGYSSAEVVGNKSEMLSSGNHQSLFDREMVRNISGHGIWQGELCDTRKSGELYHGEFTFIELKNDDGEVDRYVGLFSDVTERKVAEETIYWQANYDRVTDLPNRNLFHDRLEQAVSQAKRGKLKIGLMLLDLDYFKEVNDFYGHDVGDALLQKVAARISGCTRDTDTVARLGGDEFSIIIPGLESEKYMEKVANHVLDELAKPFDLVEGKQCAITASIGITVCPDDGTSNEHLLRCADQAMYMAKRYGRNRFKFFTSNMQNQAEARANLHHDLIEAFEKEQFEMHYQPIMCSHSGKVDGIEALIRWAHPEYGYVSPSVFLPVAESNGLIEKLGAWVIKEVCGHIKQWNAEGFPKVNVSINKSVVELWGRDSSLSWLSIVKDSGIDASCLTVEITEGVLLKDNDRIRQVLNKLRAKGITISIDDFGTGYASLSYLTRFPIDELKIDKTFVRGIERDSKKQVLVEAIVNMAKSLGIAVTAEGVESEEQKIMLESKGCDHLQGFYLAEPMPVAELPPWIS